MLVTELGIVSDVRPVQPEFLQSVVYQDNACIKVESGEGGFGVVWRESEI